MKKLLIALLVIAMVLSLAACGGKTEGEDPQNTEPQDTQNTEPDVTEPEITEPEITEPENTEPEITEPEETEPGAPGFGGIPVPGFGGETEPAETVPPETKPQETKPAETKPAETKPAETKPAETKPAETKPAETVPPEPAPTEPEPTEPEPTEPEETQPSVPGFPGGGIVIPGFPSGGGGFPGVDGGESSGENFTIPNADDLVAILTSVNAAINGDMNAFNLKSAGEFQNYFNNYSYVDNMAVALMTPPINIQMRMAMLIRTPEGMDPSVLAAELQSHAKLDWTTCTSADCVKVSVKNGLVFLTMGTEELTDALVSAFQAI